jgi:tetraacyldisaccharide 4'-kinase
MQQIVQKHLLRRSLLSYLFFPFSILFSLVLWLRRNVIFPHLPIYQPPVFTISIGNIVAGGTGKTPFTIYLAQLLKSWGWQVAVSHRGYGSKNENTEVLVSNQKTVLPTANKAGDEAAMMAHRLPGVPVATGSNRKKAIQLLIKRFPDLDCVILDDSFQHLKVKHDLDILVFNELIGLGNGFVLPAGYLREPLSAIRAADLLIINQQQGRKTDTSALVNRLYRFDKPLFTGTTIADKVYDWHGVEVDLESLIPIPVMLLSAIGNPAGFENTVRRLRINQLGHLRYEDHYGYQNVHVRTSILRKMRRAGSSYLLTTEKDYSKLKHYPEFKNSLLVLAISFSLEKDEEILFETIREKANARVKAK